MGDVRSFGQVLFCCAAAQWLFCPPARAADPADIARRAANMLRLDWSAVPDYSFSQREESQEGKKSVSRTHQVLMIGGFDYYMPVAVNDQPFPEAQQAAELQKLKREVQRRNNAGARTREKNAESYRKEREQNGELMLEFPNSFRFDLVREENINGHTAYLLAATPREKVPAHSAAAKVLAGMRGRIWIDVGSAHVVKAEADVLRPVSIFGIFARVMPGTHIEIEMSPASETVWLVSRFSMKLAISKFWLINSTEVTNTTYFNYRPNAAALAELLGNAGD
jgi:hypothetical protein